MAKRKKQFLETLHSERYLIWAMVFAVSVTIALLGKISISKIEMDTEAATSQYLVTLRK